MTGNGIGAGTGATWTDRLRVLGTMEHRPGQEVYHEEVARVLATRGRIALEGPTGTGKTLGYLVAAIDALRAGRVQRVVLSTAGKSLQDQLVMKDIPNACRIAGDISWSVLKGRSNYLCQARADEALTSQTISKRDRADIQRLVDWGGSDISIYPGGCSRSVTAAVCGSSKECDIQRCRKTSCAHAAARCHALAANLVVVNHHLLAHHARSLVSSTSEDAGILGDFDAIIVDEAHALTNTTRSVFGFELTEHRFMHLALRVDRLIGDVALAGGIRRAWNTIVRWARDVGERDGGRRMLKPPPHDGTTSWKTALIEAQTALETCNLPGAHAAAKECWDLLNSSMSVSCLRDPSNYVYWAEREGPGRPWHFECRYLDAANALRPLWADRSVVLTSATLATAGDLQSDGRMDLDFSWFLGDCGLDLADAVVVESPFDFARQSRWFVPDIPEPNDALWRDRAMDALVRIVQEAQGRALVLLTSTAVMDLAAKTLRNCLGQDGVLVQGDRPTGELVEDFRDHPGRPLVGTMSLWTGIDVPGEAASVVVIDRIPFSPPDEPVHAALSDLAQASGGSAFRDVALPRAILTTRQGVGRLIRSRTDRGVWVLLDPRVRTKNYGRDILMALPACARLDQVEDISSFLWKNGRREP